LLLDGRRWFSRLSALLGVPKSLDPIVLAAAVGLSLCALGLVLRFWRRLTTGSERVASVALAVAVAFVPVCGWRIIEDLKHTRAMTPYDRSVAGPVQAYLQPYLLDGVGRIVPQNATYATVASQDVRYASARAAFASLALQSLFPRRSVADPRDADYVVTWGVRPSAVAPERRVWRVRARSGPYPAVYVGEVVK